MRVPSRGQRLLLTHGEQLHTQIRRKASLTEDGASHPSGTAGTDLESVILPSWLDEGLLAVTSTNIGATLLPENISPEPRSLSQPSFLPRERLGQATAVSRDSYRGRALRCPHTLHPVIPRSSHVQLVGLQRMKHN